MNNLKRLAVYCGSAPGSNPLFADAAKETARVMVERGVDLVYGGGRLGLMGSSPTQSSTSVDAWMA
jgi:Predicted Rossmann fold nucleotide-binding protein